MLATGSSVIATSTFNLALVFVTALVALVALVSSFAPPALHFSG
jgi:hypothetical protein